MNLLTIFEWLERLDGWRGFPAVYIVMITAVIVIVAFDWRISIVALMVQYIFIGLLLTDLLNPQLAMVKLLAGLFVCLMLYFTGQQANWGKTAPTPSRGQAVFSKSTQINIGSRIMSLTFPMRVGIVLLSGAVLLAISQLSLFQLPLFTEDMGHLNTAVLLLTLLGLLGIALSAADPFQAGLGLLMFIAGFELYYSGIEQTSATLLMMVTLNFSVTLIISYLTQQHYLQSPMPSG